MINKKKLYLSLGVIFVLGACSSITETNNSSELSNKSTSSKVVQNTTSKNTTSQTRSGEFTSSDLKRAVRNAISGLRVNSFAHKSSGEIATVQIGKITNRTQKPFALNEIKDHIKSTLSYGKDKMKVLKKGADYIITGYISERTAHLKNNNTRLEYYLTLNISLTSSVQTQVTQPSTFPIVHKQ
ncbi:MAG: hypothetical protein MJ247_00200 [Alphaproteobacteria bacterium]|nr:hypothetical protein [Alphaproteobacteria bacterium]